MTNSFSEFRNLTSFPLLIFAASALQCYKCGGLSNRPRDITDCLLDPDSGGADGIGLETCGEGEACVTFKRLYKKASGKEYIDLEIECDIFCEFRVINARPISGSSKLGKIETGPPSSSRPT